MKQPLPGQRVTVTDQGPGVREPGVDTRAGVEEELWTVRLDSTGETVTVPASEVSAV